MIVTDLLRTASLTVSEYRCDARKGERPFTETHDGYSVSYVRTGSFGLHSGARSFELVAGSIMIGGPGDEYVCSHDHHVCGDECLSFNLAPELADRLCGRVDVWRTAALPPLPELVVLGELGQAAANGAAQVGLDEVGVVFAARIVDIVSGQTREKLRTQARERRIATEAALWIDANSPSPIDLESIAAEVGASRFHFLRQFSAVLGVTPHQYLIRSRLRHAARLLATDAMPITDVALDVGFADLSNFMRTFRQAAGVTPRRFRQLARGDRNFLQERIAAFS